MALTGLIMAITEALPAKQRRAALQKIHVVLENMLAFLLAQPDEVADTHIIAIQALQMAIFANE